MNILDRYIIRQFVVNFAILYVVLMTLFVVVDLIVNLDEFLPGGANWARHRAVARQAEQMGVSADILMDLIENHADAEQISERLPISTDEAQRLIDRVEPNRLISMVGVFWLVGDYYGPMVILVYAFFSGLIVVAAMGFTLSGLGRSRELTAMVSSGISLYRVAMPILVTGIALNVLALPIQEFVIPGLAGKLGRSKASIKHIAAEQNAFHYVPDEKGSLMSAAHFDAEHEQLDGVHILLRNQNRVQIGHITASQAFWNEKAGGWELINGYAVVGNPDETPVQAMDRRSEEVTFFHTDLSPTLIKTRRNADYVRLLPVSQLQQMQHNPAVPASLQDVVTRTKWGRVCLLVVNVLILAMGLPYFLLRTPGNMLVQSIKAAGLCIGVWAGGMTLPEMMSGTLNPVAAAWFPVVVYLPVTAFMLQRVKT